MGPTVWKAPKTTRGPKTTKVKTPKPTVWKAPKTTKVMTPRPTRPIKTPRPTKLITPRPTRPIKTPRPTATYLRTTRATYLAPTPKPTTGWGAPVPTEPVKMTGCAAYTKKKECEAACAWKSGYPPMAFSEDSDYQLLSANDESFFAVNGVVEMVNSMDSNMLMIAGVMFVAVLICALRAFTKKEQKYVADANQTYGSVAVVN